MREILPWALLISLIAWASYLTYDRYFSPIPDIDQNLKEEIDSLKEEYDHRKLMDSLYLISVYEPMIDSLNSELEIQVDKSARYRKLYISLNKRNLELLNQITEEFDVEPSEAYDYIMSTFNK